MPKNISGTDPTHSDGVFGQILVNTFAVQLNASSTGFRVYNSVSTSPLFKIDGSGVSPSATFYCDLNVIGNASFTSVSNIAVTSSMMSLATGNTAADLVDIGFYGLYHSGSNKYRGLVRSTGLGRWALFKDVTVVPSTTITLAGSWQDTLEVQDIYFNGDGSTLSALQTNVNGFPAELKNLTTAEIQQLENIGVLTISSAQWTYLSQTNQRVDTAGTPSFSGLTLSTGVLSLPAGTVGAPSLNWGDSATGLYRTALNQIGITTGGSLITSWSTTGLSMNTGAIAALAGSVGTPAINLSDTTTGFYRPGSNQIGISVSGSNVATWSSTGLAMNTLDISGVSTLTATTLQGILNSSSASQPNVTTLANVTSLGTSSASISIGTTGTGVNFNSSDVSGIRALTVTGGAISLTPSVTSSSDVSGCIISPTVANNSSITNGRGIYSNPVFNAANLSSITNTYVLFIDTGSKTGLGTVPNAYGGYFKAPTLANTSNMALYADNLNIGYTAVTPPTNGMIVSGAVAIGANAQTNSRKLYVLGDIEASNSLYGRIGTTSQNNVVTMTALQLAGSISYPLNLNSSSFLSTSAGYPAAAYCHRLTGTATWLATGNATGQSLQYTFAPTISSSQLIGVDTRITYTIAASTTAASVCCHNINYIYNISAAAAVITNLYGLNVRAGSQSGLTGPGSSITNAYGVYVNAPAVGTNKTALYADDCKIGDTSSTTVTSKLIISDANGGYSKISLTGAALNGSTATDGIALALSNNGVTNRQLFIGDTALLSGSATNCGLRIIPGSSGSGAQIDSIATNASTILPLTLGNSANTLTLNGSSVTLQSGGNNRAVIDSNGITVKSSGLFMNDAGTSPGGVIHFAMRSAGSVTRWGTGLQDNETGANTGSDYRIWNYADNGAFLSEALAITRANNKTTIRGPLTLSTVNDNTNGNLTANTYTPTLTNGSFVTAASCTVNVHNYHRVGNMVMVTGSVQIVLSSSTRWALFNLTLPYAPNNFSSSDDASGCGVGYDAGPGDFTGPNIVTKITANNGAKTVACISQFSSASSSSSMVISYTFMYQVR